MFQNSLRMNSFGIPDVDGAKIYSSEQKKGAKTQKGRTRRPRYQFFKKGRRAKPRREIFFFLGRRANPPFQNIYLVILCDFQNMFWTFFNQIGSKFSAKTKRRTLILLPISSYQKPVSKIPNGIFNSYSISLFTYRDRSGFR